VTQDALRQAAEDLRSKTLLATAQCLAIVGLSTIRERCRMGTGWCQIESRGGEGASIRFWLPRMEAAA
jgi:hypothetical protein